MNRLQSWLIMAVYTAIMLCSTTSFGQEVPKLRQYDAVKTVITNYDRGDSVAAFGDWIFVAEDDGGTVEVHSISNGGVVVAKISTNYDWGGDKIAADSDRLYVAEDDGGWIDVYARIYTDKGQGWRWASRFQIKNFDKGDGLAADNGLVYVAEDDGGIVEVYDASRNGTFIERFRTTYDKGDSVAAVGSLFFVAEDDGGIVTVYRKRQGTRTRVGEIVSGYSGGGGGGMGFAVYMLGSGNSQTLGVCVAGVYGKILCGETRPDIFYRY